MKAFPRQITFNNGIVRGEWIDDGMELRDYFAAQSLVIVASQYPSASYEGMAEIAYEIADEMIKQREIK